MNLLLLTRTALLAGLLCTGSAAAAEPQWTPVTEADFRNDPNFAQRDSADLDVVARADFNGDGTVDEARLVKSGDQYGVQARVSSASGTRTAHLVTSGPLSSLHAVGIDTLSRESALTMIANNIAPNREPDETQALTKLVRDSPSDTLLLVFTYESSGGAYVWHDGRFVRVEVAE